MTTAVRSKIIFEALSQIDPVAAHKISGQFNDMPVAANALGMAELKRAMGLKSGSRVRFD